MMRSTLVFSLFFGLALPLLGFGISVADADNISALKPSYKSSVPSHRRMRGIEDTVYERIAFAAVTPTRRFKYVRRSSKRETNDGTTTNKEGQRIFEILSFDDRVIKVRRFHTDSSSTSLFALNGVLLLREEKDQINATPSVTNLQSGVGSLWPLVKGARLKTTAHYAPHWSQHAFIIYSEIEVLGKFPASQIHHKLQGDAFEVRVERNRTYENTGKTSHTSISHYALVKNLGYAFQLDLDYKSAVTSYASYTKYSVESVEFLD